MDGFGTIVFDIGGTLSRIKPELANPEAVKGTKEEWTKKFRNEILDEIDPELIPYFRDLIDNGLEVAIVTAKDIDSTVGKFTQLFKDKNLAQEYLNKIDFYAEYGLTSCIGGIIKKEKLMDFQEMRAKILNMLSDYPESEQIFRDKRDIVISLRPKTDDLPLARIGEIVREIIEKEGFESRTDMYISTLACAVLPKGLTKAKGMREVVKKNGSKKILAFGDSPVTDIYFVKELREGDVFYLVTHHSKRDKLFEERDTPEQKLFRDNYQDKIFLTEKWGSEGVKEVLDSLF